MRMTKLQLTNFRSYADVTLSPADGVTVLVGRNGVGKTNLLEAVHLCCLGRSHRTSQDKDLIANGQTSARIQLTVEKNDGTHDVRILLDETARKKKSIVLNDKPAARMGEMMGHATCVIFSPEDLSLIKDGPLVRRHFLDMLLSQLQQSYFYALQKYQLTLKQRNSALKTGDNTTLPAWDEQLALAAVPIVRKRREICDILLTKGAVHYQYIGGQSDERFSLRYRSALSESENIAEDMINGLNRTKDEDFRRQTTSFGPHRDEVDLLLNDQLLKSFGSQGQMRTACLSLKLASFDILEENQGEPPLLLLDDVLSELDPERRKRLISRIGRVQALLTCTDETDFQLAHPASVLHIVPGGIQQT